MIDLLNLRIVNSREEELKIAAAEQNKITNLRIDKLFT
jgi:2-oxo-4-hydroxy-4-carboxy--5-ureidoimidazoline (OHCU) decarboxylase